MQWAIQILKEQELDVKVELEFRPFLLDPELPADRPVNKVREPSRQFEFLSDHLTAVSCLSASITTSDSATKPLSGRNSLLPEVLPSASTCE